jgi:gliding motility-associated-like protein
VARFTAAGIDRDRITSILWNFGDGNTSTVFNPAHQYREPGQYQVTASATDTNGCAFSQVLGEKIAVEENVFVIVPTAFTPNGDVLNEEFRVFTRLVDKFDFRLYDRYGSIIFTTIDKDFRWDGTKEGTPLPEGVYTYVLEATLYNGKNIKDSGTITLIR